MVFDYIMNKILIDIDNKTPGAISRQIAEFLIPKCALHVGTNEKTYSILQVNKHFSKLKRPHDKCKIKTPTLSKIIPSSKSYISFCNVLFQIIWYMKNTTDNSNLIYQQSC